MKVRWTRSQGLQFVKITILLYVILPIIVLVMMYFVGVHKQEVQDISAPSAAIEAEVTPK
jgi:hypothetical protein